MLQMIYSSYQKRLYYTRHAKNRMRWRGISKAEIEKTVMEPERTERIGPDRYHYLRSFASRNIRVTVVEETERIVIISAVDKSN